MCAMERMKMKKHTCSSNTTTRTTTSPPPPLSMHRESHMISKVKPTIRIIHIFAPEIIKTDVANFRELVQRLTGKPAEKKKPRKDHQDPNRTLVSKKLSVAKKMEMMRTGFRSSSTTTTELRERIKGEEEIWGGANSGGGFLGGFADLDGFMHELNQEFPLLPTLDANSHMDNSYGDQRLNLPAYS